MKLSEIARNFDTKIQHVFNEYNKFVKQLVIHVATYTIGVSFIWPALYFFFQLWVFITDGYWESLTLLQLGLLLETDFIGLNIIANYIFDLPLFFSLLLTGLLGSLGIYLVAKLIYFIFYLIYKLSKEFILFFLNDKMI
jgi:hypothetical protein